MIIAMVIFDAALIVICFQVADCAGTVKKLIIRKYLQWGPLKYFKVLLALVSVVKNGSNFIFIFYILYLVFFILYLLFYVLDFIFSSLHSAFYILYSVSYFTYFRLYNFYFIWDILCCMLHILYFLHSLSKCLFELLMFSDKNFKELFVFSIFRQHSVVSSGVKNVLFSYYYFTTFGDAHLIWWRNIGK